MLKFPWLLRELEYSVVGLTNEGSKMADSTNHYARHTPRDRDLRASDRDRDAVGDFLRRQHVAGRLDTDEFADRYGRCLEAKTYAQLDALITDLPADEQTAPAGGPERVRGGRRGYGATYGAPWRTGRVPGPCLPSPGWRWCWCWP